MDCNPHDEESRNHIQHVHNEADQTGANTSNIGFYDGDSINVMLTPDPPCEMGKSAMMHPQNVNNELHPQNVNNEQVYKNNEKHITDEQATSLLRSAT